ncbi:DnaJ domain-containing protein [Wenzhouxiangella sp. XN79A]|uniref:DnaJ C-terminal domain-containing protein n=1 Tax=Wenzhouxiangella sp. XN79A TaxID=2724193 RepID=UPI00144AEE58|nr:DnaJ C-terminal domain-containing protein [Wenzhouxiangella sp. XN79A]NKI34489.1 DnaJ domain-containing protein [Wenzhouxiangella sp. XN79A]
MEFKDYYSTMGVSPDAGADAIKKAYRRLARKYHPDVSDEPDAEARFKELGEAYEVLRDPEKREAYDQLRRGGHRPGESFRPPPDWSSAGFEFRDGGGFHAEDLGGFSDFFESLFGSARRARPEAPRGRDLRARIDIDLETAFAGGSRRISLGGDRARSLDVRIPAGVTEGKRIRLAGKGEPGPPGAPPGDLYLDVHLQPHRTFEVDERDVQLVLPIAPWEAALGAAIEVPTLAGRVAMKIPPGAASGQRLRLRGRGLPGSPPGDQYVTLKIVAPPATEDTRPLYEQLRAASAFDPRADLEDPA